MKLRNLIADVRGAAVIDFAFAMPVLITLMIGILQLSLVLQASGAMRNAVGEGMRYAKVHPSASESDVLAKARAGLAGINPDGIVALTLQRGTTNGADFARITMRYQLDPMIPFADIPPIVLNQSKFAYLPT